MTSNISDIFKAAVSEAEDEILERESHTVNRVINEIMKIEKDFIYGNSKSRKPDIKKVIIKNYKKILEDS
ncbi:hypothetical protein [Vibrio sp. Vb339]|uniref:hypothetical protein n=1 Tax=Vibrio sp. Vb339 TaxID=1192013 RepID=UPI0015560230|nr:hypothetical protein [Vibrio sp. Vb339]